MSALKNHRHEAFAQALVRATRTKMTNGQCYSASGYQAAGEAAEVCAARLLGDVRQGVGKRVQEIMEASATRVEVTTASLLGDLNRIMAGAETAEQFAAAKAAVDSKARLKGLFLDKLEIGAPGAFDQCESPTEVAEKLLGEMGTQEALDTLDAFRAAVLARASDQAKVIGQLGSRRGEETEQPRCDVRRERPGRR